jgi:hypothetical protein
MDNNKSKEYYIEYLKDNYKNKSCQEKLDNSDKNVKEDIKKSIDRELKKSDRNYYSCV